MSIDIEVTFHYNVKSITHRKIIEVKNNSYVQEIVEEVVSRFPTASRIRERTDKFNIVRSEGNKWTILTLEAK